MGEEDDVTWGLKDKACVTEEVRDASDDGVG